MIQKLSKATLPTYVELRPYLIAGLDTCVLQIVCDGVCLLTDIGAVCLDITKMRIDYGKNDGPDSNSRFVTLKIFEAVRPVIADFQFEVHVVHVHGKEVRFKLKPLVSSPKLSITAYFETSQASFNKIAVASERKHQKDRKISKILQFRSRTAQAAAA